jgi:hypothetical protein
MIERAIHAVQTEDPSLEEPAATRSRLRHLFPAGAARRLTQLGLLMGGVLDPLRPGEADGIVYASSFGESRALHEYLASFPTASPTLFQTSIHPSAVQQFLVARQQPVREFFPFGGSAQIVAHAAQAALLSPLPRAIFCGGEERALPPGSSQTSSPIGFAFALALGAPLPGERALGALRLAESGTEAGELGLPDFFAALRDRRPLDRAAAPGLRLILTWS